MEQIHKSWSCALQLRGDGISFLIGAMAAKNASSSSAKPYRSPVIGAAASVDASSTGGLIPLTRSRASMASVDNTCSGSSPALHSGAAAGNSTGKSGALDFGASGTTPSFLRASRNL